ncbi:lipase-like PAD4 [Cryptomeria japonica]|uniref:lipase-like PAD4 n=1 Tax=Cryptomeria japonica TaxID=3369 RepID=UPI0027DA136E|nr:lipase-like PAD4 [Cryptomeria japonica]
MPIKNLSKQNKEQPIVFVGHSIGGAIATLATICFLDKRLKNIYPLCITFGSPLVGNAALRESIGYHDWFGRFCHVVSKHDVVPRMLLAPFESVAAHLNSILGNASDPQEDCRKLLDNFKRHGESSPYKPFGAYMFCSTYGAACIEDSQAALEILILTLQSIEENDISGALISEHTSYGDLLEHVIESGYSTRTSNISSASSFEMGIALQLEAMGFQTQISLVQTAFDALKKAADLKHKHDMEIKNLTSKLSENQSRMAMLEWYIKIACKGISRCSYNVFRDLGGKVDFKANEIRVYLHPFWDKITNMVKNHQLPSDFRSRDKWIYAGKAYRKLAEPLDIADHYRQQSYLSIQNRESYLSIQKRPLRYRVLEKWLDDKMQTLLDSGLNVKKDRTMFASLIEDSCFWARVEEADKDLTNLQQEQEQTVNAHIKKSLKDFEVYVSKMIEEKSISEEVFFEDSGFMIWWEKYKEFQLQYSEEWESSSPLLKSMGEVKKLGVQKTGF